MFFSETKLSLVKSKDLAILRESRLSFLASKLLILFKRALKPLKSFLNLKLEKITSLVEESIQEAT